MFGGMARSDGFDSTLATVILDEVSTDEAKLILELAYGQDRCIDYLVFLVQILAPPAV